MKAMRKSWIFLVFVLLSTPLLSGQDLSSYRKFTLGTSLTALSKQVGQDARQAILVHQSPAAIQELTYWPTESSPYSGGRESVSQILFSFYNTQLYRIVATYDQDATEGMTDDDMVRAISARYGTATKVDPEIALPANGRDLYSETVIARWEDSDSSVILARSSGLNIFDLTVSSKRLGAQAEAAIADSLKLEKQEAPQHEVDRQKAEADKLAVARLKNIQAFRF